MPNRYASVFVSATSADLRAYRAAARDALLTAGVYPVMQEYFEPDSGTLVEFLRKKIARCEAVICLVGTIFGAEPTTPVIGSQGRRSYTQLEFDIAWELNKPTY